MYWTKKEKLELDWLTSQLNAILLRVIRDKIQIQCQKLGQRGLPELVHWILKSILNISE
jgi:hypothetical protein